MSDHTREPVEDHEDAGGVAPDDVTVHFDPPHGSPDLEGVIRRLNRAVGVDAVSVVVSDAGAVRVEIVGESIPGDVLTAVCSSPADHRIVALHTTDAGVCRCCLSLDPDVVTVDAGRVP